MDRRSQSGVRELAASPSLGNLLGKFWGLCLKSAKSETLELGPNHL